MTRVSFSSFPTLPPPASSGLPVFYHSTRFIILILTTAALTFCLGNPLIFNFTIICMDDLIPGGNSTGEHWLESSSKRNLLFSATAMGNLIGTFPVTLVIEKFGTKNLFLLYGLLSATATTLFPLAVQSNVYPFICTIRFIQGFAMAFALPGSTAVSSSWAALKEGGLYISVLMTHQQLCAIFTMPVSGALCTSPVGWRGVYYLQAVITFALFALFQCFYTDDPENHRKVSEKELSKIALGKDDQSCDRRVPYLALIRTPAIIGVWLGCVGGNLGFQLLLMFGPTYLNKVLHFEIASTGFATALPYLLSALVKFASGPVSDHATCISQRTRMIIFASLSQGIMAFCYLVMAWTTNPLLSQVSYTAAIVFSGLNVIGIVRCAQLVARQHMHFVMSVMNGISCTICLVMPPVVGWIAGENSKDQWSLIFYASAFIIVAANITFPFVASSEPAPWTKQGFGIKVYNITCSHDALQDTKEDRK